MVNEIHSEREDLFDPNMCIIMTFDVVGEAEPQKLVESARRTFSLFEATMSRIVITPEGMAYYEKMPSSGCTSQVTQKDFESLIKENEKRPFDLGNGDMMRVFVKHSNNNLRVLIMSHHLAGDGKSVIYFIEQMMRQLAGEGGEYRSLKLLNEETLPKNTKISGLFRAWVNCYNRAWAKDSRVFDLNDRRKLWRTYWSSRESIILRSNFSPEDVKTIHKKAKAAGVSVNTWIAAALMRENKHYRSVGLAVDARIDGNRTMSNQATGITADYRYDHRMTFEQNAQRLHKCIYKKLNKPTYRYFILHFMPLFAPPLIDSVMMYANCLYSNKTSKAVAKMMGYAPLKTDALSITNLTRLDIPDSYGYTRIENLCFVPPAVSYSYETFGAVTTSSGMTVTLHSMSDRFTEQKKEMFDSAMEFLKD